MREWWQCRGGGSRSGSGPAQSFLAEEVKVEVVSEILPSVRAAAGGTCCCL